MPENLLPLIERHRVTSFFAPPTIWISLLRSPLFERCDLSSLRKGYYGASIMPVEVLKEIQRRLPALRLWNLYGQTEVAPVATVLKPHDQLRKAGSAMPQLRSHGLTTQSLVPNLRCAYTKSLAKPASRIRKPSWLTGAPVIRESQPSTSRWRPLRLQKGTTVRLSRATRHYSQNVPATPLR